MAKKEAIEQVNLIDTFKDFKETKNIDRTTLVSVIEDSFRSVLQRTYGSDENFDVIVNPDKGDFEIYRNRVVVEDDSVRNENAEISLSDARKIDKDYEIGEEVSEKIEFAKFGRRAILTLRQTMASKILDLEKEMVPAQLKLDMKSNFELAEKPNLQDSKLTVTVIGKGVKDASKVLNNAVLGLYITEDGLTGKQYGKNGNGWYTKYNHENTLIAIATENPWGDEIVWDGDNFEKTYEITIPKKTVSYTTGKTLNAVAFVSLPFVIEQDGKLYGNGDIDNVWVNQCFFMDINKGETTGIKTINGVDSNATVVARFAADGTQISAPVKGLNILKMSDGTTRKVMVK